MLLYDAMVDKEELEGVVFFKFIAFLNYRYLICGIFSIVLNTIAKIFFVLVVVEQKLLRLILEYLYFVMKKLQKFNKMSF